MKTKISQQDIPSGWQEKNLGDISDLYQPQTISKEQMSPDGKYLVFGANGIIGKYEKFNHKDPEVIVTCRGASCGSVSMTPKYAWITGNAMVIKVDEDEIIKKYIYYYLNNSDLNSVISGGAQPQITRQPISAYKILLPPLKEQQKIAEILGAVDEYIAKTQELIEATEKLKRGLMQELFTRGIGHTTFKKTKLGDVCNFITGKLNSNRAVVGGEYPFFTCSQETFEIDQYSFDQKAILLAGNNAAGKYSVKYYEGKFDAYQRTYVISVKDENETSYSYIKEVLNARLNELQDSSVGSTTKFLTLQLLQNLSVSLPPIKEQKKIADILSSIDEKIAINKKLKEKLILLKKGLMQDLLSGRVRVNIQ